MLRDIHVKKSCLAAVVVVVVAVAAAITSFSAWGLHNSSIAVLNSLSLTF